MTKSDYLKALCSPRVPDSLEEIARDFRPRPNYLGPGAWLAVIRDGINKENCTKQVKPPYTSGNHLSGA